MDLTTDDKWILNYLKHNAQLWDDVKFGAIQAMSRIQQHKDLVDWADYFLPQQRIRELKRELALYRTRYTEAGTNKKPRQTNLVSVQLSSDAVRLLKAKAVKEHCSSSELILKYIA